MKKPALLLFVPIFIIGCKKKEETPPKEEPTPTYQVSMKINDQPFNCNTCYSSYESGGLYGVNVHFPQSQDRLLFSFNSYPTVGKHNFVKFGAVSFTYQKNNAYIRAVSGELNITAVDSSSNGAINKFTCTFNCVTDTVGNESFRFTEGKLDIQ